VWQAFPLVAGARPQALGLSCEWYQAADAQPSHFQLTKASMGLSLPFSPVELASSPSLRVTRLFAGPRLSPRSRCPLLAKPRKYHRVKAVQLGILHQKSLGSFVAQVCTKTRDSAPKVPFAHSPFGVRWVTPTLSGSRERSDGGEVLGSPLSSSPPFPFATRSLTGSQIWSLRSLPAL
jgi:hypothetical protein